MKSWTTQLGQWMDRKEESFMDEDKKHSALKISVLNILDGWFIGSIIMYPIALIACYYWRKKAEGR